jgi:hypothetical protein
VSSVVELGGLKTHVFLLLMDMANLEPYVLFIEWPWGISHDVLETLHTDVSKEGVMLPCPTYLQTLLKLLLLLVDYTEPEIDLICFFEIGLHPHHLTESLFGVFK